MKAVQQPQGQQFFPSQGEASCMCVGVRVCVFDTSNLSDLVTLEFVKFQKKQEEHGRTSYSCISNINSGSCTLSCILIRMPPSPDDAKPWLGTAQKSRFRIEKSQFSTWIGPTPTLRHCSQCSLCFCPTHSQVLNEL